MLVVVGILSFDRIDGGLNDAVRHADAQNRECVPQPSHEDHMTHIPNPFKVKWKHNLPS